MKPYHDPTKRRYCIRPKGRHSVYIGTLATRRRTLELPDLTLKISAVNEMFKSSHSFFIRSSQVTSDPLTEYSNLTYALRDVNRMRIFRDHICAYRLFGISQFSTTCRATYNIAAIGQQYTISLTDHLLSDIYPRSPVTLSIYFTTPRTSQLQRRYKEFYVSLRQALHMTTREIHIDITEPYAWDIKIQRMDLPFLLMLLYDLFRESIDHLTIRASYRQLELSQTPNIDGEDYFYRLDEFRQIRLFQPYGTALKLVRILNSNDHD